MSFNKVILIALYSSALAVVVQGRETISQGGGAGGGSNGRGDNKASSTTSLTSASSSGSSGNSLVGSDYNQSSTVQTPPTPNITPTITPAGSGSSTSSNNNVDTTTTTNPENGKNIIESSTTTTISNVGSSSNVERDNLYNSANNNNNAASQGQNNNNNNIPQNFGTTGSLADRPFDVLCPICDAVPDKSYDESRKINMGGESWTCGYLQETVQDADQNSPWADVRGVCRQSQLLAEDAGCCAQTMYINMPGEDLNDPCELCGGFEVPLANKDKLVNTGILGSHTCGGIDFAMKQGVFSSNNCGQVSAAIFSECCLYNYSQTARSAPGMLRGAVVP